MSHRDKILGYLDSDFTEPIRDPLWNHIHLSPQFLKVVNSPAFHKLDGIKQLGITYLVYPGATHTRLAHSLGVFHLARRILRTLLGHEGLDFVTAEGVRAFLAASLLHDLGHFPFTHSLKELPLREHEQLTGEYILSPPLSHLIKDEIRTDPWTVAAIVDTSAPAASNEEILFFRHLLSGVLDPDKLDYLNRDAFFCGVPYGIQDIDFILNRIKPHQAQGMAIDVQGMAAIENLLFSKYLMYRSIYWHRTVRIATAMIKKALILALLDGCLRPQDLYGLDDEGFFREIGTRDYPPLALIQRVAQRDILKSAWERPFDDQDPRFSKLLNLHYRVEVENRIADRLSRLASRPVLPEETIIDIPEKISFEVDLPVILQDHRELPFPEAGTVFSRSTVKDFVRTLRVFRLAIPRHALGLADLQEVVEASL